MTEPAGTILIVDDEPANLKVLSLVLQGEYRVRAARCGADALNALKTPPTPDLVLLDIMMPDMDGYDTLKKIHQQGWTNIPVIFVTALDDEVNEQHGLKLGAADYITKPIKAAIVRARVKTQLELKAARDHLEQQVEARTEQLSLANRELRQSYIETVRSFSVMLENRDPSLAGHAKRVADSGRRIGRKLGLSEKQCNDIVFAGLLSRIGTITLSKKILAKPVIALRKEERDELMICTIGAKQIFKNIPPLHEAANIIAHQFERYDGSGFPRRLIGEDIPVEARILSIARDFDLFLEGMIDSKKHDAQGGREYLKRKGGSYYDPRIVALYNSMIGRMTKSSRPIIEVGLVDIVEGMELAEVHFGSELFVRDTIASKELIEELGNVMHETGLYCSIKVRVRLSPESPDEQK
jgi:putative two-component system response regulator